MSRLSPDEVAHFFETISPESLAGIARVYREDAYFKDPFNEVHRIEDIRAVFERMFEALDEPAFAIVNRLVEREQAMLEWNFTFRIKRYRPGVLQTVHGVSHLRFAPDGRICYHRDYWDVAGELYAKLPVIGGVMRFLGRKLG
ncbi:MAG: nuclear transport factor 2 family protein [Betaproteobacteria bacterium]